VRRGVTTEDLHGQCCGLVIPLINPEKNAAKSRKKKFFPIGV